MYNIIIKLTFSSPERYRVCRVPGVPKLLRLSEYSKRECLID